jgi:hypothetical protein
MNLHSFKSSTQKRAKLGPDSPTRPDPGVLRLQRADFLKNISQLSTSPPQQCIQKDDKSSVPPFGRPDDDSEVGGRNDTVQPDAKDILCIHWYEVQGDSSIESASAVTDSINNRPERESESSTADDAPVNQAYEPTVYTQLEREKREWKHMRGKETGR